ncbi:hypothetical protein EM868_04365 [Cupriavidus gilardii]|uniref:hypothetical protein n=1 Tax=Cupriavidus gilardii TaxID=82541 RepID=UPI001EE5CBDB|nr:hypothetical protein [Cupriavidus gilardii]MCG5258871.1 hypothetical protein [Cupriavidus gilardii]MDF9429033.1 hypothetical protein [Cupriavidus gilardii]
MKDKSSGIPNPVAPQSVESLTPEKGPLSQERGQNPAAEADTLPSESNPAGSATQAEQGRQGKESQQGQQGQQGGKPGAKPADKPGITPNEVMNEQVSPPDEQGDRMQSDRPHIGG